MITVLRARLHGHNSMPCCNVILTKGFNAIDPTKLIGCAILARATYRRNRHTPNYTNTGDGNEIKPNNKLLKWSGTCHQNIKDKMTPYPFCHFVF